jgi:hypothetical protein
MPAARVDTSEATELERIEQWRAAALARAGFSAEQATTLAARHDVDLHTATDLVAAGCPPDVAFDILV